MLVLNEIDCVNKKLNLFIPIRNIMTGIILLPIQLRNIMTGIILLPIQLRNMVNGIILLPDTVAEKLKNVVCGVPAAPQETVVVSKVEKPVTPKEAVVGATAVIDKNLTQVNSKQKETKTVQKSGK